MDIAFVNQQDSLGGAETVLWQLNDGLRERGHQTSVYVDEYAMDSARTNLYGLYPRLIHRLDHSRFHKLVQSVARRRRWTDNAFRRLANSRHDIIHIHNFHGTYASIESLAYLAQRKTVVWTFHAFWGITGGCEHPMSCDKYQYQCGDCPQVGKWPIGAVDNTEHELRWKLENLAVAPLHIISPSAHVATRVGNSQVGQRWDVHHIPNGVDSSRFHYERKGDPDFRVSLGLDHDKTTVLVVNRNFKDPDKGFPILLETLSRLNQPGSLQVVLAGDHSGWAASQLSPHVGCIDAGYEKSREKMADWFEAADIFLFASAAENFPCVILEAMSSKCCIVSTPTNGITEQIQDQDTGFVGHSISADGLLEALIRALESPSMRKSCGDNARISVEREFSEALMIDRHTTLYDQLTHAQQ